MAVETLQLGHWLEAFTELARETDRGSPFWLRSLREDAFARFCATGFPTTREEDWRFTNVGALARTPFRLGRRGGQNLTVSDLEAWRIPNAAARLVFINGRFSPPLSSPNPLPAGIMVRSTREEIAKSSDAAAAEFARFLRDERDPFCALNLAFAADGASVKVTRGTIVKEPIHLLFVSVSESEPVMAHPLNRIVAEDESQLSIVEDYVSIGAATPALSNATTELIAGRNATVEHILMEREHRSAFNISTLRIEQERNANVASHSFLLGGALVRNNVHPRLAGEGGECLINGLFIGSDRQHLDNYMLVEHASPHCASRQFYNGILDDQAHGVFQGRIVVHKDAQKTDAKQTNRNLLLNDDAQIDTKPQLEIHADDVKCTHGATIGQIEEEALFYLRSRGIAEAGARRLLLEAFAGESLDRIAPGPAREYLEAAVSKRLVLLLHSADGAAAIRPDKERSWGEVE
jgi:Fe-S cluster assembly protein SufD